MKAMDKTIVEWSTDMNDKNMNVYYKIRKYTDYYYAIDQFNGDKDIINQFNEDKIIPLHKWRDSGVQVVKYIECETNDNNIDYLVEVLADKS